VARFFFHIFDGMSFRDEEGTELDGWREARFEAVRLAGEVIASEARHLELGEDWHMEVADAQGLLLFRLDFLIAASAAVTPSEVRHDEPTGLWSPRVDGS
jgi:hypothetical protein